MNPAGGDPVIAALRAELAAIAAALEGSPGPGDREASRQRIIALFKRVEATIAELSRLKEEIRPLVDRYKKVAAAPESPPAVHQDHLNASTFIEKGWSLMSSGDPAAALVALRKALELAPGDTHAESLLGWAQMQSGELDEALETFSRVLVREPSNALARVNVGYICLKKRVFGEAIEHLSRVIRSGGDAKAMLYAHYYLGLVYLERGMFVDAESFLRQALRLGPNLIEAYHDLGRAQWLAGRREEARASWQSGAQHRFTPWAKACQDLLDRVDRGEEVVRSTS